MKDFTALVFGTVLVGCVSDNSTTTPQGSLGGPCFANGTCNTGLSCVVIGGTAQCEASDATVDGAGDAPVDAPVDSVTDHTSSDVAEGGCNPQATLPCSVHCTGSNKCCTSTQTCGTSCGTNAWACETTQDCTGASACCIGASLTNSTVCPPTYQWSNGSYCATSLSACTTSGRVELCVNNSDCTDTTTHCQPVSLTGITPYVGICLP